MQRTAQIFRFAVILVIVMSIAGLGAWYFFLRSSSTTTENADAQRGYGSASPTFNGSLGSTYQNVLTDVTGTGVSAPSTQPAQETADTPPQLWHVSANPTAGMGFIEKKNAPTKIYFVERATGYVFSADAANGALVRVSNTLRPKIYEAFFSSDGAVLERSLDDTGAIVTFAATLTASTSASSAQATSSEDVLSGTILEPDISSIAVSPSAREMFYIVPSTGGPIGIRTPWNNKKPKRVFSSELSQWQAQWLSDGRIFLTQNAADNIPGSIFELKSDGSLSPILQDQQGLTVLPKSGSPALLFGTSINGTVSLFTAPDQNSVPVKLPIKTTADKCVWSPGKDLVAYCAVPQSIDSTSFLDDRYSGSVHTSDSIWRVNAKDGTAQLLFSPVSSNATIDVVSPMIDSTGLLITFLNATDRSLWLLRLSASTSTASH